MITIHNTLIAARRPSLVITLILYFAVTVVSQVNKSLPQGWERYGLKNIGAIDIPPSMELQSGLFQRMNEHIYESIRADLPEVIFQQKGVNVADPSARSRYARIIIHTEVKIPGSYKNLDHSVSNITNQQLLIDNERIRQEYHNSTQGTSLRITEWFPVEYKMINGMFCLHIKYQKRLGNNPEVIVNIYRFENNDRVHELTFSHYMSKGILYLTDFKRVLESFVITNIKSSTGSRNATGLSSLAASQANWIRFRNETGNFIVDFPNHPHPETVVSRIANRNITRKIFSSHGETDTYQINYHDLPLSKSELRDFINNVENYYDNVVELTAKDLNGRIINQTSFYYTSYLGRECKIETQIAGQQAIFVVRIVMIHNRVYTLTYFTSPEYFNNFNMLKFFNSFKTIQN